METEAGLVIEAICSDSLGRDFLEATTISYWLNWLTSSGMNSGGFSKSESMVTTIENLASLAPNNKPAV